jgi:hypothetical protein
VRRSIPIVVIVLAALAASAGYAKNPTAPAGTWDLQTTQSASTGPRGPIRTALTRLIQRRVTFTVGCAEPCAVALVKTARGRLVKFVMRPDGRAYTGQVAIATGLRCGGRAVKATLKLTAAMIATPQEPGDRLTGSTVAVARNPGKCALFRGQARASRTTEFYGVAVTG